MTHSLSRRTALKAGLAGGVAFYHTATSRRLYAADTPNEKLNIACIGVGGRGEANVSGLKDQNFVAFVDVDQERAAKSLKAFPNVPVYADYRVMLDELAGKLDAVVISTPDHTHFHPAYAAMQLGLHVYLEKPLAHNVWETRTLCDFAREKKLATQLGAQRHAMENMHRVVELVQSGAIGKVSVVYSWVGGDRGMPEVPTDKVAVPASLDYELWLGPVVDRKPYHPSICPYGWRFWWDFGTGETGNWGCHILDIPFWSLGLRYPKAVQASGPEVDAERTPKSMQVKFEFPAEGDRDAVTLHWQHGTPKVLAEKGLSAKGNNTLFVGDHGMLLCGFDRRQLLPEDQYLDFKAPEPFVEDSPGFHKEFVAACKGGEAATCNFDYSGPLAEAVLLGNVAYRAGGFEWDWKNLKTVGNAAAQSLIQEAYRPGWEV